MSWKLRNILSLRNYNSLITVGIVIPEIRRGKEKSNPVVIRKAMGALVEMDPIYTGFPDSPRRLLAWCLLAVRIRGDRSE